MVVSAVSAVEEEAAEESAGAGAGAGGWGVAGTEVAGRVEREHTPRRCTATDGAAAYPPIRDCINCSFNMSFMNMNV